MMVAKLIALIMVCLISACSYIKEDKPDYSQKEKTPIKARPDTKKAKTLTELGSVYYQQGKYEYAQENLERALKLDDKSGLTYQTLALIQVRKSHPEQARKYFLKAMQLAPEDMNILTHYAVFLYGNNEKEAALLEFNKVVAFPFYGNKWVALTYLGLYDLKNKQQRAAEINFYHALRNNPSYAPALIEMARIRYVKAEMMSARGFIERYFSQAGNTKPLAGLILAIKIERSLGDEEMVAKYQLELIRSYPFSDTAEQIKHNKTVN